MRDYRLAAVRPFVSLSGEDGTETARAAVRVGIEGSLLRRPEESGWVSDGLTRLFKEAFEHFMKRGTPVPSSTLLRRVKSKALTLGPEIAEFLGQLRKVPVPSVPEIVDIVGSLIEVRDLLDFKRTSDSVLRQASEGILDVGTAVDQAMTELRRIRLRSQESRNRLGSDSFVSLKESASARISRYMAPVDEDRIRTGYAIFDEITGGGLRAGDFLLFQARTNTGKSRFLQHIAMTVMRDGGTAVLVSGEMSETENFERVDGTLIRQDYLKLTDRSESKTARLARSLKLLRAVKNVPGDLIVIPPAQCRTTGEVREVMLEITRKYQPKVLLVDYLTLFRPSGVFGGEDWAAWPITAAEFKLMGYEFGFGVASAAQTKRDALQHSPRIENLAFSDGIAHVVDYDFEARYNDPAVAEAAESGLALEDIRQVDLFNLKSRKSRVGYRIPLSVNFATGEIIGLDPAGLCTTDESEEVQSASLASVLGSIAAPTKKPAQDEEDWEEYYG